MVITAKNLFLVWTFSKTFKKNENNNINKKHNLQFLRNSLYPPKMSRRSLRIQERRTAKVENNKLTKTFSIHFQI